MSTGAGDLNIDCPDLVEQVISNELLIRTILGNFSAAQLENARLVCQRWNDHCKSIFRHRSLFDAFLLIYNPRGFRTQTRANEGSTVDDENADCSDKQVYLHRLVRAIEVYKSDSEDSVIFQLERFLTTTLHCYPAIGILFTSSITLAKRLSFRALPPSGSHRIIVCSTAGIVGKPSLAKRPVELERYHFKLNAITGLFVARPWADFKVFITDWKDKESPAPDQNDPNYPVKAAIILSINFEDGDRFNSWLTSNENPLPIAGALVDKICWRDKDISMMTISFAGKNLKAASFIMDSKTSRETEAKLQEFKRNVVFDVDDTSANVKTIGFLFICAGRGAQFYHGVYNVESNLVHKIFPHVMFSGIFGNGEYGWNCYNQPNCEKGYKSLSQGELALSYTTAILLIQFYRGHQM